MNANAKFRVLLVLLFTLFFASASLAGTAIKVMTYNVDEGTDFSAIVGVLTNGGDFAAAVEQTIAEVESSHPEVRMQLIAKEIAAAQPDLVGLQEAAVWTFGAQQIDLLNGIYGILAYLPNYKVVVQETEFQISIPGTFEVNGVTVGGVGFMDRDVILARTDLANGAITVRKSGHYNHLFQVPASQFLPAFSITRGWAYADVLLGGTAFRFITTHLEDGTNTTSPFFALVQAEQEIELVSGPASTPLPVIVAGDFNTVANNPFSLTYLTYSFMLANGFADAWSRTHPFQIFSGATCCQENLRSSTLKLTQRLDQVFVRNHVSVVPFGTVLVDQFDAVDSFWPSDHAAVKSALQVGLSL